MLHQSVLVWVLAENVRDGSLITEQQQKDFHFHSFYYGIYCTDSNNGITFMYCTLDFRSSK